ncbi:MAG: SpoIIE family protein phosphatase [Actinobacteria bacterium]|nr:SpoIIE family protein phosphatase [Actinomycetota bacterium]
MSQDTWLNGPYADVTDLTGRREALRHAAALPGADPRALLDAAFAELDAAVDLLTKLVQGDAGESGSGGEPLPAALSAERSLLRAVFQHAPVPLFVLEIDGTIRRANGKAGELIGTSPGYAAGRPLTAFADLASRAALDSQLAAVVRTETERQTDCVLLGPSGPVTATLSASILTLPDGARLLLVAAGLAAHEGLGVRDAPPDGSPAPRAGNESPRKGTVAPAGEIAAMTRRMDLVTAVTRLLLDNSTFSEAVTLQRCARLLAAGLASWVIVDIERMGELRRQFVIGPHDEASEDLARRVRAVDPAPGTLPAEVHSGGRSVLLAHADAAGLLGADSGGTPLLMLLGATSLLSVPVCDGDTGYGVLTLARQAAEGRFDLADLGLAEELGEHLGVAIRVDRMFRHRSAVAEALQSSLLPARLPDVPWLDLSAAYLPASEGLEVSGDFYDVFPVADGWAIAVGDVCGKGQEAAAMTAAARHAIRAVAHWNADPVDVLAKANEVILAGDYEDRFVTVKLAYLRWVDGRVRVELASSGHPGPAVVHPDGRVDVPSAGGLPLGLFPDAAPERETLELGPDDLLFFYTDGVTEARNPDMQYFEERLADELAGAAGRSAAETTRMVQSLVADFAQDDLRDDMTILVAKVKQAVPDA